MYTTANLMAINFSSIWSTFLLLSRTAWQLNGLNTAAVTCAATTFGVFFGEVPIALWDQAICGVRSDAVHPLHRY